jgi:hypothetical protein
MAQIILSQSRMNNVLTELHGGLSGCHLGISKIQNKVQHSYYWLHARKVVESGAGSATRVQPIMAPKTRILPNASVQH